MKRTYLLWIKFISVKSKFFSLSVDNTAYQHLSISHNNVTSLFILTSCLYSTFFKNQIFW